MITFLAIMVTGLVGLLLMALPGLSHHAGMASHGAHGLHTGHGVAHAGHAHTAGHHGAQGKIAGNVGRASWLRLIPSPRTVFSLMASYGAFGVLLVAGFKLSYGLAALLAILPAFLFERFVVTPYWNWLTSFGAAPATPLTNLVLTEAVAVTNFQNGRGLVQVEHDGRAVQMMAYLRPDQSTMPVRVGDKLLVEAVDEQKEHLTVSLSH